MGVYSETLENLCKKVRHRKIYSTPAGTEGGLLRNWRRDRPFLSGHLSVKVNGAPSP